MKAERKSSGTTVADTSKRANNGVVLNSCGTVSDYGQAATKGRPDVKQKRVSRQRTAQIVRDGGPWIRSTTDNKRATERSEKALKALGASAAPNSPFFSFMSQVLHPLCLQHEYSQRPPLAMNVHSCGQQAFLIPFRGKVTVSVFKQALKAADQHLSAMAARSEPLRSLVLDFRECEFAVSAQEIVAADEEFDEYVKSMALGFWISDRQPLRAMMQDYSHAAARTGRVRTRIAEEDGFASYTATWPLHTVSLPGSY